MMFCDVTDAISLH